jgi:hypothetical protein
MIPLIEEIVIQGVYDRGVPNKERIALKVLESVDLSRCLLLLGFPINPTSAYPLKNHVFLLGQEQVVPPHWILIYTGPGERKLTREVHSREPALVLHLGEARTILHDERVAPILISVDGILVGSAPQLLLP